MKLYYLCSKEELLVTYLKLKNLNKNKTMSDQESTEILEFIKKMIDKYPNDQELGKEIRKYYLEKKQQTKSK